MQVGMAEAALFANGSIGSQTTPKQAAQEFEALLIGQLIKAAREAGSTQEEDSLAGSDTYREFAEKVLAESLARNGSFGFARMILRSLQSSESQADTVGSGSGNPSARDPGPVGASIVSRER